MTYQQRFAVIGNPILHSKSPDIFNFLFGHYQIDAWYLRLLPVDEFSLCELFEWLNLSFVNITTPYKEYFYRQLTNITKEAQVVQAVNTVIKTPEGLLGINTDIQGVVGALEEVVDEIEGKRVLVFGAGPAARSAVYGLKMKGADVWITNRTNEKAQRLAKEFGLCYLPFESNRNKYSCFDILVLATLPEFNPFQGVMLNPGTVVLNANYRLNAVDLKSQPIRLIGGERWLVHQACAAFESYFGFKPDRSILEKVMFEKMPNTSVNSVIIDYPQMLDSFNNIDILVVHRNNAEKAEVLLEQEKKC
ncbi:MAG TPA: hypothetical protein PK990_08725 [Salinivirgaceae bacterium]|nr:hypothetical protein [Salinivirgaceae bacterium]